MDEQEWFAEFDLKSKNFEWFFHKYGYTNTWNVLLKLRTISDIQSMRVLMNEIWFALPEGTFNIIENPKGWSDFLYLLEA